MRGPIRIRQIDSRAVRPNLIRLCKLVMAVPGRGGALVATAAAKGGCKQEAVAFRTCRLKGRVIKTYGRYGIFCDPRSVVKGGASSRFIQLSVYSERWVVDGECLSPGMVVNLAKNRGASFLIGSCGSSLNPVVTAVQVEVDEPPRSSHVGHGRWHGFANRHSRPRIDGGPFQDLAMLDRDTRAGYLGPNPARLNTKWILATMPSCTRDPRRHPPRSRTASDLQSLSDGRSGSKWACTSQKAERLFAERVR